MLLKAIEFNCLSPRADRPAQRSDIVHLTSLQNVPNKGDKIDKENENITQLGFFMKFEISVTF